MDDILDLIQDTAESIVLYDIRRTSPEAQQLAQICQMTCERVKTAVACSRTCATRRRSSRPARKSTAWSPMPTG